MFNNQKNLAALREALTIKGYPGEAATVISLYPSKFLWEDLQQFWEGKSESIVSDCTQILAKMEILTDPGVHMNKLLDVLA